MIVRGFWYSERDLNPHNLNGHKILSLACLPFHHPSILIFCKAFALGKLSKYTDRNHYRNSLFTDFGVKSTIFFSNYKLF